MQPTVRHGSKSKLVNDLLTLPGPLSAEHARARDLLVERARGGYYHDQESWVHEPKIALQSDLWIHGFVELSERVATGVYHDAPEPPPAPVVRARRRPYIEPHTVQLDAAARAELGGALGPAVDPLNESDV